MDDEAIRLEATERAFRAIVDHAREGGSFRYLIYDRLGFGPEAYRPLYLAGGMVISNAFELSDKQWAAAEEMEDNKEA